MIWLRHTASTGTVTSEDELWSAQIGDLTDALARGRLTAGELAALAPQELDALYELGATRLETDRLEDAATIFAGLITLFPYTARYWRAYGVALHRLMQLERAVAAYDAALRLEPHHVLTRIYRAEVLIYSGRAAEAQEDLSVASQASRQDLRQRAERLQSLAQALAQWKPPTRERAGAAERGGFTLSDGSPLPLADTRFPEPATPAAAVAEEVTLTAQTVVPEIAQLWEPPELDGRRATAPLDALALSEGEGTVTGTLARGPQPAGAEEITRTQQRAASRRPTLPLRRVTETALIPGRAKARALQQAAAGGRGSPVTSGAEVTQTAITRRRQQESLLDPLTLQPGDFPLAGESEWDG